MPIEKKERRRKLDGDSDGGDKNGFQINSILLQRLGSGWSFYGASPNEMLMQKTQNENGLVLDGYDFAWFCFNNMKQNGLAYFKRLQDQ